MYYTHRINPNSPLNLHDDLGYGLLCEIHRQAKRGLHPIHLPSIQEFKKTQVYYTELVPGSRTLAELIWQDKEVSELQLERVWQTLVEVCSELYSASQKLPPSGYPVWSSVDKIFLKLDTTPNVFHCSRCTSILKKLGEDAPKYQGVGPLTWTHGDIHPGNILWEMDRCYVIDLENLHPAPVFSDLFIFAALSPLDKNLITDAIKNFASRCDLQIKIIPAIVHATKIAVIQHSTANQDLKAIIENSVHWIFQNFQELDYL